MFILTEDGKLVRAPRPRISLQDALNQGYTVEQIRAIYGLPANFDGAGMVIAVLEYGSGYNQSDLDGFCDGMGIPRFTPTLISVDGGQNDGGTQPGDLEGTLDLEWVHAMAPGAKIVVFYAPNPPDWTGFAQEVVDSLIAVQHYSQTVEHVDAITGSYGDAEENFPKALMQQANADAKAMKPSGTITGFSSGDQGDYGTHQYGLPPIKRSDWPATCPDILGFGGTKIPQLAPLIEQLWDESGFGATGGTYSEDFPRPPYQNGVHQNPGRGVCDLSLLADPFTGYKAFFMGQWQVVGGTSVSCPVGIGLLVCLMQARKLRGLPPITDMHTFLYSHPEAFRDIEEGNNGLNGTPGEPCVKGWDPPTGLGAPRGDVLLTLFTTEEEVVPVTQPTKIPVFVDGKEQPFDALLQDGYAYCPIVDTAKALGFTATRDLKGVYITTAPKAP